MQNWYINIEKGKDCLSKHRLWPALRSFNKALKECPVSQSEHLYKLFFYLGVTLKKLGLSNIAIRSWCNARKIKKSGYSSKMLKRFSNAYGMAKQKTSNLDDWKAFYSIQLAKYLKMKPGGKLSSNAEKDMISDLILDSWKELLKTRRFDTMSPEDKMSVFNCTNIIFPVYIPPDLIKNEQIHVNFRKKKKMSMNDRCICGSGLTYGICCGHNINEEELFSGHFDTE